MYLNKKTYVKNWEHQKPEEKHEVLVKKGGVLRKDIKPGRVTNIEEEMGYWRKANHIHNFFIERCGNGDDNCCEMSVCLDDLLELKERCEKVIKSLEGSTKKTIKVKTGWSGGQDVYSDMEVFVDTETAEELLPTTAGFFFGSVEYDEYYLQDCKDTLKIIGECLEDDSGDFYYEASW
jgi:hypothetical protein